MRLFTLLAMILFLVPLSARAFDDPETVKKDLVITTKSGTIQFRTSTAREAAGIKAYIVKKYGTPKDGHRQAIDKQDLDHLGSLIVPAGNHDSETFKEVYIFWYKGHLWIAKWDGDICLGVHKIF